MDWQFVIFGFFVIAIMAWGLYKESGRKQELQKTGIQTTGLILRNKICWGRITVVRPIVQFQTKEGKTLELMDKHGLALAIPRYSKGTQINLIYDPAEPANFSIVSKGIFG